MTLARRDQVHPETTPYYHCISRCVRRAWLCGWDRLSGRDFSHRKAWVVEKLAQLADAFTIHVCAYAILSNHIHTVLHIDVEGAQRLTDEEVLERYGRIFRVTEAEGRRPAAEPSAARVQVYRERLSDLSWFMKCLNEAIAKRANAEDGCTGRFWEGRFRSQALLDEAALLTCMSYVDLNPVRAGAASSLEGSDFTSIQQRLREHAALQSVLTASESASSQPQMPDRDEDDTERQAGAGSDEERDLGEDGSATQMPGRDRDNNDSERSSDSGSVPLLDFAPNDSDDCVQDPSTVPVLPIAFDDYLNLVQWTGEAVRCDKAGALPPKAEQLLERCGVETSRWVDSIKQFHRRFFTMVGHVQRIRTEGNRTGRQKVKGTAWAARVYRSAGRGLVERSEGR